MLNKDNANSLTNDMFNAIFNWPYHSENHVVQIKLHTNFCIVKHFI